MRQPVVSVKHPVNAAFQNFVSATELLRVLQHVLRFDQTQFPLTVPHDGPEPTADWMLPVGSQVV